MIQRERPPTIRAIEQRVTWSEIENYSASLNTFAAAL
jgi:hypothetical protein